MNDKRYKWILYTIILVIGITIAIQVFWNFKNYEANKRQFINDIQLSLDKAVDDYYADLAERTTLGIALSGDSQQNAFDDNSEIIKLLKSIDETSGEFKNLDSVKANTSENIAIFTGQSADSLMKDYRKNNQLFSADSLKFKVDQLRKTDSLKFTDISMLTTKVFVSINNDTLDIKAVDSLLDLELQRKDIIIDRYLNYYNDDTEDIKINGKKIDSLETQISNKREAYPLHTSSRSTFLPKGSTLEIHFENATSNILKRSLVGIIISTLLILAVISCLLYLLHIIKHQKQLSEVKNDLISNITHEFKTPIATIGVALESINNFNGIDDKEKTKKYINMSTDQLNKLNMMVEKLLETASLDSDSLELNKEPVDIVKMLDELSNHYKIQCTDKQFNTDFKLKSLMTKVDVFHFENALNNILDNAVKYGGEDVSIELVPHKNTFEIKISDNGNTLNKANKDKVFEKFYRVSKGNTHDVKGFGIGLYYTKTIIDKHGGSIALDVTKNLTTFKITLPNG